MLYYVILWNEIYIFGIYIIEFRSIKISMFPCDYVARCLDINISSRSHITTSLSEPSYFITKRTVNKCKVAIEYCVQAGTKRLKWNIIIRYITLVKITIFLQTK